MPYDPQRHHRRSIRLPDYDYTLEGAYFVTICTQDRACLLGEVVDGEVLMNVFGELVRRCWDRLPQHYGHVSVDAFVIMPNHVHGIIVLMSADVADVADVGAGFKPAPTPTATRSSVPATKPPRHALSEVVRAFKTFSARRLNSLRGTPGQPVWQRNYYEQIIRSEGELERIREYIVRNPSDWERDEENPANGPRVATARSEVL